MNILHKWMKILENIFPLGSRSWANLPRSVINIFKLKLGDSMDNWCVPCGRYLQWCQLCRRSYCCSSPATSKEIHPRPLHKIKTPGILQEIPKSRCWIFLSYEAGGWICWEVKDTTLTQCCNRSGEQGQIDAPNLKLSAFLFMNRDYTTDP